MMGMANNALPPGWKKTSVIYNGTGISTAAQLGEFLADVMPNCKYAFGTLDRDMSVSPPHNTVTAFVWSYNSTNCSAYQRARNATYQVLANWTSTYDTVVTTGSMFTVLYVD